MNNQKHNHHHRQQQQQQQRAHMMDEEKQSLILLSSSSFDQNNNNNNNRAATTKTTIASSFDDDYDDGKIRKRAGQQQPPVSTPHATERWQYRNDNDAADDDGDDDAVGKSRTRKTMSLWTMVAILSTAFSYGCVLTTLFLITLPLECDRIERDYIGNIPSSIALGIFVAIAGTTQLISPVVGRLSDTYRPPTNAEGQVAELGQRMPYMVLGSVLTVLGLLGQTVASEYSFWIRYGFAFFCHMIGLNIMYTMMIALIPDQVPSHQTAAANGCLAFLLVTGSLFGFGSFHSPLLGESVPNMYRFYTCIVIFTSITTATNAHDEDARITQRRMRMEMMQRQQQEEERRRKKLNQTPDPSAGTAAGGRVIQSSSNNNTLIATDTPAWRRRVKRVAKRAKNFVLTPAAIVRSVLVDPVRRMDCKSLGASYTMDITSAEHYDFFIVTISRLFYYCGMSVQTFFLYYLRDVIRVQTMTPEAAVASLAILAQCAGAVTCYPVGVWSDMCCNGRRKPFVYASCAVLGLVTLTLISCTTMEQMVYACLALGGANGVYLVMDTSLAVDTLPKEEGDNEQEEQDEHHEYDDDDDDHNGNGTSHGGGNNGMNGGGYGAIVHGEEEEQRHQEEEERNHDDDGDDDDDDDDHAMMITGESSSNSGTAQLLGIWGVAAFVGSGLGPMIGGPLLYIFGGHQDNGGGNNTTALYSPSAATNATTTIVTAFDQEDATQQQEEPVYSLAGYAVVLSLACFYFLCSAVSLAFIKNKKV